MEILLVIAKMKHTYTTKEKKSGYQHSSIKGVGIADIFISTERYMYVEDASLIYGVSEKTIRRWCKNGKLDATLCKRGRFTDGNIVAQIKDG